VGEREAGMGGGEWFGDAEMHDVEYRVYGEYVYVRRWKER
jgi:hypothetical protein